MIYFSPLVSGSSQEAFVQVFPQSWPLRFVRLGLWARYPSCLFSVVVDHAYEVFNEYFEELGFQATNTHKLAIFTRIEAIEWRSSCKDF